VLYHWINPEYRDSENIAEPKYPKFTIGLEIINELSFIRIELALIKKTLIKPLLCQHLHQGQL